MKPAKPFIVEIRRNGRRLTVQDRQPMSDAKLLQSATEAVEVAQESENNSHPVEKD